MKIKYECCICDWLVLNTKAQVMDFCLKNLEWDPKGTDNCTGIKNLAVSFSMWVVISMESKLLMLKEGSLTFENEMCQKILAKQPRRKSYIWLVWLFLMLFNCCTKKSWILRNVMTYIFIYLTSRLCFCIFQKCIATHHKDHFPK